MKCEIPSSLGNLTKLSQLWLSDNCLEGTIPWSLIQLTKLEQSSFHANSLKGSLTGFCDENNEPRNGMFIAAECGACPYDAINGDPIILEEGVKDTFNVECDCCICCDPISTACCSSDGSYAFPASVVFDDCPAR